MVRKWVNWRLGAVFVLVGAILLGAALAMPWYAFVQKGTSYATGRGAWQYDTLYYLGIPSWNGTVQYSCSGAFECPAATSYSTVSLDSTGALAEFGLLFVSAAVVLGFLAGVLGAVVRRTASRNTKVLVLGTVATVLGALVSVVYAATLQLGDGGPWNSFWGSTSGTTNVNQYTNSWGPGAGWYLSIAAVAALLVGVAILYRHRRGPSWTWSRSR